VMNLFSLGERLVRYESNHVEKNKLSWDPQKMGGIESASVRCKSRSSSKVHRFCIRPREGVKQFN
jgi:hypothetical protein